MDLRSKPASRLASLLTAAAARLALCTGTLLLAAAPVHAADRAEAYLFVLEPVDVGGVTLPLVVPQQKPGLADSGPSSRPTKAFEALRARSPKAYGATSLRIDSATKATLVLDKVADADQVLAEVFWTLASLGFTDLSAPPYVQGTVTLDKLSYGSHALVLNAWDLFRFHDQPTLVARAFVLVAGAPVPADQALDRLKKGDVAVRKLLADAMTAPALRPKLAILEAVADGTLRDAFKLKADDALPALADESLQVRGAALDAVVAAGFAGSKTVIPALEALVETDPDAELKLRAVKALSKAGVAKYDDLLESEKLRTGTASEAMLAVLKLSRSAQVKIAAPALVGALSHSDAGVREAAFKGLVELKQFELLHEAMKSDVLSAKMKEDIARVLVDNGSAGAADEALLYLLTKGSAPGAIHAAQVYGKRGARTASPQLIEALKHESAEVRQAAAEALALLKEERAIVPLADAAGAKPRDREYMMAAAVQILGSLRLDQVQKLVDSKNTDVRQMAIRALAEFAKGSRPNPAVVAILQQARKDPDIQIKRSAIYALARLQDDGIVRDLAADHLNDADGEIVQQVALALANASARYADADKLLEDLAKHRDKKVRIEAINGLARRKNLNAVPMLIDMSRQPDPDVLRAVFAALLALRDPQNSAQLRPVFQKGMDIKNSKVRLLCIEALSDKTTPADIEALRAGAFDDAKEVKLAAIRSLGDSKLIEAMDALANFFGDADMEVREKSLEALGSIPAGDSRKQKTRYLQDFIETPDMPDKLKKRAVELQKAA